MSSFEATSRRGPPDPQMVSYAQNFEDVLLRRVFRDVTNGFYVDVGAFDPVVSSVTKHFYDLGWRGINLEPGTIFERLEEARPEDVNLNIAISDHEGSIPFFEDPNDPGISSVREDSSDPTSEGRGSRLVQCATLESVLERHARDGLINFLKIDAEGHEAAIVRSTNWRRFRPQILLIEATLP